MKSKIRQDFELTNGATEQLKKAHQLAAKGQKDEAMQMALAALKNGADYRAVITPYLQLCNRKGVLTQESETERLFLAEVIIRHAMILEGKNPELAQDIKFKDGAMVVTFSKEIELNGVKPDLLIMGNMFVLEIKDIKSIIIPIFNKGREKAKERIMGPNALPMETEKTSERLIKQSVVLSGIEKSNSSERPMETEKRDERLIKQSAVLGGIERSNSSERPMEAEKIDERLIKQSVVLSSIERSNSSEMPMETEKIDERLIKQSVVLSSIESKTKIGQDFELIAKAHRDLNAVLKSAPGGDEEKYMQMALAALKNGAHYLELITQCNIAESVEKQLFLAKVIVRHAMMVEGRDPELVKDIKLIDKSIVVTFSKEIELNEESSKPVHSDGETVYVVYVKANDMSYLFQKNRDRVINSIMKPHAWCLELELSVKSLINSMLLDKLKEASEVLKGIESESQRMLSGRTNSSERYIRLLREKPSRDLRSEFEIVSDLPKMRRFAVDRAVIALKGGADTSILFRKLESGAEKEKSFAMDVIKSYFTVIAGCDEHGQSSVKIKDGTLELRVSAGVKLKVGALDSTGTAGVYSISLEKVEQLFRFSQIKAIVQSDGYAIADEKRQEICDKADELIKDCGNSNKTNETLQNCKELKVALAGCQEHALDPLIKIVDSIINAIEGAIQKTLGRYTEALDRKEQKGSGRNF